jgi:rRNA maturation RNase YbeY
MAKVFFHYADRKLFIKNRRSIKKFLEELFKKEGNPLGRIDYVFCSNSFLLEINQKFLSHDYYTDIITFDLSEDKKEIEGEIYISLDIVKENSQSLKVSFEEELLRVVFHGALHLCGYSDKSDQEIKKMRSKENYYIKHFEMFQKTLFPRETF